MYGLVRKALGSLMVSLFLLHEIWWNDFSLDQPIIKYSHMPYVYNINRDIVGVYDHIKYRVVCIYMYVYK